MKLSDEELAAAIKACDIHRQSLMRRVGKMRGEAQRETLAELDHVARASDEMKAEQRRRLPVAS